METVKEENLSDAEYENFEEPITSATQRPTPRVRSDPGDRISRDLRKHHPIKIPKRGNKQPRRVCRVCISHKLRSETSFMCKHCKVTLHVGDQMTKYPKALIGMSKKGKHMLMLNDSSYSFNGVSGAGKAWWRCSKTPKCRSSVHTMGGRIIFQNLLHNGHQHRPSISPFMAPNLHR